MAAPPPSVGPGFEWYVAWRHLRDPERRSHKLLTLGLVLLALGLLGIAGATIAGRVLAHRPPAPSEFIVSSGLSRSMVLGTVLTVARILAVLGGLLSLLGVMFASLTLFTALSVTGVFLGTAAPIIALSVMSGFEADLKTKIRATKADVVVTRNEQGDVQTPFTDWQAVQAKVGAIPDVVASMAYIEAEVIIRHATNPAGMGIVLRGIEPGRAPKVLDLGRTMTEGKVEYLDHPDKIPLEDAEILPTIPDEPEAAPEVGPEKDAAGASKSKAKAKANGEKPRDADSGATKLPAPSKEPRPVLPGILLGEELYAHTLRVFLGSEVDVACPLCGVGPTGPMPRLKSFRVAGHFYTGMYEFDSKLAYISLAEAQKFLNMQGEVTGIEVRTSNPDVAHEVADEISRRIGPGYEVRSWEELNKGLFMALRLEKITMFVVLTFIALVASFSIISTLLMLVTQKGREIAILKSMGARDGAIMRIFFAEGLYIGLLGLLLGLPIGIATCLVVAHYGLPLDPDVYYIQKLPVVMRAGEIALISTAVVGLCCLATLYPAFLASRMRPVDGLRYE
jgi:lipoprotein-releasing system permease protein